MPEYPGDSPNYPTTPDQYAHHYEAEDVSRDRHYTIKAAPGYAKDHPYAHEVRRVIGHDKSTRIGVYETLEQAQFVANALNQWAGQEL